MTKRLMTKAFLLMSACMFTCMAFMTPVEADGWYDAQGNWTEKVSYAPANNPYAGAWNNCTWSAWQIALEQTGTALPEWGSAGSWLAEAAADGYATSSVPAAGSIIVWSSHVGYVQAVSEDGSSVYVLEGGYRSPLGTGYNEGWYPAYSGRGGQALLGYIYLM